MRLLESRPRIARILITGTALATVVGFYLALFTFALMWGDNFRCWARSGWHDLLDALLGWSFVLAVISPVLFVVFSLLAKQRRWTTWSTVAGAALFVGLFPLKPLAGFVSDQCRVTCLEGSRDACVQYGLRHGEAVGLDRQCDAGDSALCVALIASSKAMPVKPETCARAVRWAKTTAAANGTGDELGIGCEPGLWRACQGLFCALCPDKCAQGAEDGDWTLEQRLEFMRSRKKVLP